MSGSRTRKKKSNKNDLFREEQRWTKNLTIWQPCNKLLQEFEDFKNTSIKKLESKDYLLKSHLEGYIRNQLKLVDSRYQVLLNLLKDITAKASEVAENHSLFAKKLDAAANFIQNGCDKLQLLEKETKERRKDDLEGALRTLKSMAAKNSEEGQRLVHDALFAGEKALLSTPSTGQRSYQP